MLAPFVLLRVAGQPAQPFLDLAPPRSSALIDSAIAEQELMESAREELKAALHAVVPIADRRTRAAALNLKRAVHNRRTAAIAPEELAHVRQALDARAETVLARWGRARDRLDGCLRALDACGPAEIGDHLRPGIQSLAAGEDFRRALALAAPLAVCAAGTHPAHPSAPTATKNERTLLAYLMRAAMKTSPFGTFLHIAVLDPGRSAPSPPALDHSARMSRTVLNRGLAFELFTAALGCCGDPDHATFLLSPTVVWTGDGFESMAPMFGTYASRIIRLSRPVRRRLHPELCARIARLPERFRWTELMDVLTAAGLQTDAAQRLGRALLESGVITPTPWTDAHRHKAHRSGRRCPEAVDHAIDDMTQLAERAATASSAERLELRAAINASAAMTAARLGSSSGSARTTSASVAETGFFREPVGPIGETIGGLFDEVASALRPRIERRAEHSALERLFVGLYGEGGTCHDTVGFLCRAAAELGQGAPGESGTEHSDTNAEMRPRVPASVLLQIAATDRETDPVAVINRIHAGCGWLSARYAMGDSPAHAALQASLRSWLRALAAPAEPVDLLVSGDCNELQTHPRVTARALACPLEPAPVTPTLTWRDLTLQHRPQTGAIEIRSAGAPILPVYLGATFPHAGWGPTYWLTVLANPWRVLPVAVPPPPPEAPDEVWAYEQQMVGRVVMRRKSWWMTSDRARRVWFRQVGVRRSADTALDCARLGLPPRFYVTLRSAKGVQRRKPLFVDTRNPFLLDILSNDLRDAAYMEIVEPLPDTPDWPVLHGQPHVSEILLELSL
ncbi:hypothetical protein ACWGIA_34515 [Streptomyces bobili]